MSMIQGTTEAGRIDIHHHILPPDYVTALEHVGVVKTGEEPIPEWEPRKSLEVMDEHGIAAAITSISSPGVYFKNDEFARDLARRCNEYSARLVRDHPGRFGALAVLPLPDCEGALRELEYAVETLKLDGVVLLSNAQGRYLGDESFDELFAELDRRKLVVLIHPARPPRGTAEVNAFVEYPLDVTRAVGNMVVGRILERFGSIRFIVAHAGGSLPFLGARFSMAGAVDFDRPDFLKAVFKALKKIKLFKRLYYDMAGVVDVYALRTLAKSIDPTHLLFGTNYMWTPSSVISSFLEGLRAYDAFDDKTLSWIERKSALRLFPRFR